VTKRGKGRPQTAITAARDAAIAKIGPEAVYDFVRAGLTMPQIAERLGLPPEAAEDVRNWLRRKDPEAYQQARKDSADAHEDRALSVLGERAPATNADASWRRDKMKYHQWVSDLRSGRRDQAQIQVNIGQMHLDALKAQPRRVLPAEVLPDE
jgi:hypothetical protein